MRRAAGNNCSVRLKAIVGICLAVTIPECADPRMREKDTHTTAPRLPDMMVYVPCSIEEILFGTKIEVTEQQLSLAVGQITFACPE